MSTHQIPEVLDIEIGGFFGPSCHLAWIVDHLAYQRAERGDYQEAPCEIIVPTAADWTRFWKALDTVGFWAWKPHYIDPDIDDGTQWSIHIRVDGKRLQSEGSNAYPVGASFDIFCRAVQRLIGGRRFG